MKRLLPSFLTLLLASLGAHAAPTSAYSEAVINASPAQTWQALTTKEGMESWMVAKAEVDFLIGGLLDRKSTRLNSSHSDRSRMPSSA